MDKTSRRKEFLLNTAYYLLLIALVYVLFKYAIPLVMPFVIAFLFAALLKPPIRLLVNKLGLKQGLAAALVTLLFYSTAGLLLVMLLLRLFALFEGIFIQLPQLYEGTIEPALAGWADRIQEMMKLPGADALVRFLPRVVEALGEIVSTLSIRILSAISGLAASLPSFLIGLLITIISTFFITMDYPRLTAFILRQLPERAQGILEHLRVDIHETVGKYIKSYSIIMAITFFELAVGLMLLGVGNALLIALATALFDILPVLGVGGILLPWTVIALFQQDFRLAIGLLVLYLVITVIRNIMEPKIVGDQVGIHPLATLLCMYVGLRLFGGVGLFGLPILVVLLKRLNDAGRISLFK